MATDLVVFDCDGVLVDSETIVIEIEAQLLTEAGFALTVDEICDRYVGVSHRDMMDALAEQFGRPVPDDLAARIRDDTLAAFPTRLRAVDGIDDFLVDLGMPRCVASGSDLERVHLSLELTGLAAHFDPTHVFSSQMVARGKPAPDLFLHAARMMVVDPSSCLVIEDSPHGVEAAMAAGMEVVGFMGAGHVRPSLEARLRAAGATRIVHHASALKRCLADSPRR